MLTDIYAPKLTEWVILVGSVLRTVHYINYVPFEV